MDLNKNSSKDYPLFPELSKKGIDEAQALIDKFKHQLIKVSEEVIGDLYVGIGSYIESDAWSNMRNDMMDGFKNYETRLSQNAYDFKDIRKKIYEEYREEIIKDLNSDLLEEIEGLKDEINSLRKTLSYYRV